MVELHPRRGRRIPFGFAVFGLFFAALAVIRALDWWLLPQHPWLLLFAAILYGATALGCGMAAWITWPKRGAR